MSDCAAHPSRRGGGMSGHRGRIRHRRAGQYLVAQTPYLTCEGEQEMRPRSELGPDELLREVGSVLRMSEAEAAALAQRVGRRRPRTRR